MVVQAQSVPRITPEALKALIDQHRTVTIVDVRQPGAYFESPLTILGAIRIPPDQIDQRFQEIPRDHLVVTFCT
ncbi:MAG: rhodanese-like domain-containing protein [Chloroflexota bacterium]